jgi:hypothetical protein
LSTESLKERFAGIDSSKLVDVEMRGPLGEVYRYQANPIRVIKCVDRQGQPVALANGPSIEMRVTHNKKKTIFYFDRVFVNDSTITGVRSRFIGSLTATIPLNDITKIEVQNGGKNYRYAGK